MKITTTSLKVCLIVLYIFLCKSQIFGQQTATDFFKISTKAFNYNDYDNAIFFANKAIQLSPKFGGAYWNLALAYDYKGNYHKSIMEYDSALTMYDNYVDLSKLHKNRGTVYITLKQYDSAISDLNKAIEMHPEYGYAYSNLGIAYDGLGKFDSAINNYTRAMKFMIPGPDMSQVLISRGIDYLNLKNKEKANADFKKAIKMSPEPGYYSAWAIFELGEKEKAEQFIELYLDKAKAKPEELKTAYFYAASVYSIMNDENNANKYLFNAIQSGYNDFVYIAKDRDFDNIRNSSSFIDIIRVYDKH